MARPPADPDRIQFSLLDLSAFMGLIAFFQGVLMWLGTRLSASEVPPGLKFHAISLPATMVLVFTGLSWGMRTAQEGGVEGGMKRLGLHLLGVGAMLGLLALVATVLLGVVCALTLVGALTEIPFAGSEAAEELPRLAKMLGATTGTSSLLILAGWVRRTLRRRAGDTGP